MILRPRAWYGSYEQSQQIEDKFGDLKQANAHTHTHTSVVG